MLKIMKLTKFLARCVQYRRGLAMRILSVRLSVSMSVCLSVCPCVKKADCGKTGKKICPDFYTIRKFSLVVWEEKLIPGMLGQPDPVRAKSPILNRYSLVAPQP